MGYRSPRPIQGQAAGPILAGRDFIGLAQTGRGKTAAFMAPLATQLLPINRMLGTMDRLRTLIICPTRELAVQIAEEGSRIMAGTGLRLDCVYGKVAIGPQAKRLAGGVDILVGTPGRLRDLVTSEAVSLGAVRCVVLDEADRMLDMGFRPQVDRLLSAIPRGRQTLLFTATMPKAVEDLARTYLNDPERVEVDPDSTPVAHVQTHLIEVADRDKVPLVLHLLEHGHEGGVLVFCATRRRVGWVGAALRRKGIRTEMLHGDRSHTQRATALAQFADGEVAVLVATDVASRGLHIDRVRTVINYDIPPAGEDYVHRVGRAAHGGGKGDAFTLLSHYDLAAWERVVDSISEVLVAEDVSGFERTVPAFRNRPQDKTGGADGARIRRGEKRQYTKRYRPGKSMDGGRSRRSKPIKPGQKPGGGVRRTKPTDGETSGPD